MPQSKFGRRKPKYTPPKVCKKSPRGGAFDVPGTTCPTANRLTATILWHQDVIARVGAGALVLFLTREAFPGCHFFNSGFTPNNEPYEIALDIGATGLTSSATIRLLGFNPNQETWINHNAECDAASPTIMHATQIPTTRPTPPPGANVLIVVI